MHSVLPFTNIQLIRVRDPTYNRLVDDGDAILAEVGSTECGPGGYKQRLILHAHPHPTAEPHQE